MAGFLSNTTCPIKYLYGSYSFFKFRCAMCPMVEKAEGTSNSSGIIERNICSIDMRHESCLWTNNHILIQSRASSEWHWFGLQILKAAKVGRRVLCLNVVRLPRHCNSGSSSKSLLLSRSTHSKPAGTGITVGIFGKCNSPFQLYMIMIQTLPRSSFSAFEQE